MSSNRKRMSEDDVQRAEEFPLHHAVRRGNINIVEDFLKSGADPNQKDHRETTPIHHLEPFHEDSDKMVHVPLKYGADMLSRDCYGSWRRTSSQVKYSRTSLIRTPKGQSKVSVLERCPF